ncbi:MAG: PAS domain-containing protein, partial [Planctomycetota bacterium]
MSGRFAAIDEHALLRHLVAGTVDSTGTAFFRALVRNLAEALVVRAAWVTEYQAEAGRLQALAFWVDGDWTEGYAYDIAGTPCERVVTTDTVACIPTGVIDLFPEDPDLATLDAVSYFSEPLHDEAGRVIGNLAVIDDRPLDEDARLRDVFRLFAARAAGEARRLLADRARRASDERARRLVDCVHDAIIECDAALVISQANPAARTLLSLPEDGLPGRRLIDHLDADYRRRLLAEITSLDEATGTRAAHLIPGGLVLRDGAGGAVPVEASIARAHQR